MLLQNQNSSQNTWTYVNQICGNNKSETKLIAINKNNKIIIDTQFMANEFYTFFSEIGETYAKKISPPLNFEKNIWKIHFIYVLHMIKDVIKSLKNKKSSGRNIKRNIGTNF